MSLSIIYLVEQLISPLCAIIMFLTMLFSTGFTVYIIFRDYIEPMLSFNTNPNANQNCTNNRLVYALSQKLLDQEKQIQKQRREIARLFNM
jgi:choline-glycine betaine transporter